MVAVPLPDAHAVDPWFTVELPDGIDMAWCQCPDRQPVASTSVAVNDALTDFVAPPGAPYRHASVISYGHGSYATTQAMQALRSSAAGQTWAGHHELPPGTNVFGAILLRNPGRPNGGPLARVAPVASLFGVDTVTPPSDLDPLEPIPDLGPDVRLATSFIDVGRQYDAFADFPATANPVAIANSVAGGVFLRDYSSAWPVNLNVDDPMPDGTAYLAPAPDRTVYYTQYTPQLPLLEPPRLVARAISDVTGLPVGTPLVDRVEPAATIVVNVGYTDVQTPSRGGTYNRTLDQMHVPTPFMSRSPLTPREWARVPGDVVKALVDGPASSPRAKISPAKISPAKISPTTRPLQDVVRALTSPFKRPAPIAPVASAAPDPPRRR